MSRGIFGWDLPPGVSVRMIDEQCGDDEDPDFADLPPIEADHYGEPCEECPKRGRETPNLIDLDWGICSQCDGEHGVECAALPDEEKERLADLAMLPRFPR